MSDISGGELPSPEPKYSYVCWMDIMGTGNGMYQNISDVAKHLLQFQILAKDGEGEKITIYPMMDGIYVVSEDSSSLIEFLKTTFKKAAQRVVEREVGDVFIIRAGISYGPIVEGGDFTIGFDDGRYKENIESLLIGPPMVEAYGIEEKAPPFGISVHESARAFSPENFEYQWYEWYSPKNKELANELRKKLESYFNEREKRTHMTNYEAEKIDHHRELIELYLPELKLNDQS